MFELSEFNRDDKNTSHTLWSSRLALLEYAGQIVKIFHFITGVVL